LPVTILCVGKLRERFYADAVAEYHKRICRLMPVIIEELPDERGPESGSAAVRDMAVRREGERILARVGLKDYVIALCVDAKQPTSEELAGKLEALFVQGKSNITFVVGGSYGLSPQVLDRADERVSMSRMTFPHQLARVMLIEQLYRSAKMLAGEVYHK